MHEAILSTEAFKHGDFKTALIDAYLSMDKQMASEAGIHVLHCYLACCHS